MLSEEARGDLRDIEAWVADHDGEARAMAVVERIENTMQNLAFMPGMGRWRDYLPASHRAFPAAPWTIVYTALEDGDGILVQRILHARRDLSEIFENP